MQDNNSQTPTQEEIFLDESSHLNQIKAKLSNAHKEAERNVEKMDEEYKDIRFYMSRNRNDIDPHEMFQAEMALRQVDDSGVLAVKQLERMNKLINSPYFARIDFKENGDEEAIAYYIGLFSFLYEHKTLICDWRAPVSTMFYDYEIGPAQFDPPRGHVEGELLRKRQFKIKNGVMEYALESSMQIQDDVLQKELSSTSDEKMKTIIATIQKEQNKIIRSAHSGTMIIQGVAGSGKTSIALHRIAFLLYRFKEQLNAKNITILSPNKVFGDYISNVLPELGEEQVYEMNFLDIANIQLEYILDFEPQPDPLEVTDKALIERSQFKSTLSFVKLMEDYVKDLPERVFTPADFIYGEFTIPQDWIQGRYNAYARFPVSKRLEIIADDIEEKILTENIRGYEMPKRRSVMSRLKAMLSHKSTIQLYRQFYKSIGKIKMLKMPNSHTLEWNDIFPYLYLQASFDGVKESLRMKHIVIDEMQDYTPIQYAVIEKLFKCPKTILGDYSQFIHPFQTHTLEDMLQLLPGAELMILNKSYRSTYEIIQFAKQLKPGVEIDVIERHGDVPEFIKCSDKNQQLKELTERAKITDGTSMGIITKSNELAKELYEALKNKMEVNLISPESKEYIGGVSIVSVQMSKGLEFDAVLIPNADSETYNSQYDKSLLYVACTRAMHKLDLLYTGEKTALLK